MRAILTLFSLLLVGGCSAVDALNRLAPEAGIATTRGLAYGTGQRRVLDVYRPTDARGAPIVVFFYGGSWQEGERADYAFVARALAQAGIVVVVPDYRVFPEVRFEGFMRDAASAVAWTRKRAESFGGDPNRLLVMGHSAGAHMAAMLALDPRWLAAQGLAPRGVIAGVVGLAGPYDFLPTRDPILQTIFGTQPGSPPEAGRETQPINFVDGRNPPMFLGAGSIDTTVLPRNTKNLAARFEAAGGPVTTRIYSGLGHRTLLGVLSQPLGFAASVRRDVTHFIQTTPAIGARTSSR